MPTLAAQLQAAVLIPAASLLEETSLRLELPWQEEGS